MTLSPDGDAHPCPHGSRSIGNVLSHGVAEVWNGSVIKEVRASILAGNVHDICRTSNCPHQQPNDAFSPPEAQPFLDPEFVNAFDDGWYLENNPDVRSAVDRLEFISGLEHFAKFGQAEGRAYRLISCQKEKPNLQTANALMALQEYSRGATEISSLPVDVVLQISSICNLHCVMCGHGMGTVENPRHMPLEIVDKAAPYLSAAARMIFSGMGEPLLAPGFWKVIANYGGESTVFIRANSNAHFITPEKATRIMDSGLKELSFSLDAATSEIYTRIRGGDFQKALDGAATMCAIRRQHPRKSLEIFINMTLMRENIAEAPAFVELAHRLQVDAVIFGQLLKFGDQPDWIVRRDSWWFGYSDQMLRNAPDLANRCLLEAKARADALGVKLIFLQNTHLFLEASWVEKTKADLFHASLVGGRESWIDFDREF